MTRMPATINSQSHRIAGVTRWHPEDEAQWIAADVLMSPGNSNSYLVAGSGGDVLINTGWSGEATRHRERYQHALGRGLALRKIIFTQTHSDHIGGRREFEGPDVETIAHRSAPIVIEERARLRGFWGPRAHRLHGSRHAPDDPRRKQLQEEAMQQIDATTLIGESDSFEVGGRRFDLISTPNGETLDSLIVWLPAERIVFAGNLTGALWGALPNFYTIRGDRIRSASGWVRDIDRVLELEPVLLATGHEAPLEGAERIREELGGLRDAVAGLYDYTIRGMGEGKSLWALMSDYEPPASLPAAEDRGKAMWFVRAVWEELAGWFRFESTTELYPVPPSAVATDIVELAGGAEPLAQRAREHVTAGRPLEAIHLTDIVLAVDPDDRPAREAQIAALELLLERSGGRTYDEVAWLESEIAAARSRLA